MESNENNRKGFMPIEPNIYDHLNGDYDLIISCFEYIRGEIPTILNIDPDDIEVFLVSFCNFLGQYYPAIGIRNKTDSKKSLSFDFFEIDEKVENWLANFGIENLKQKATEIKSIDWKTLQDLQEYPSQTRPF
ncbi:hypothetical protein [Flavobacterium pectinovorum]|uniref:Uncharacterized protein n=1 Tax=Flavobacterium pectinovorum TaxID=29533 RepID=A0A502F7C1_9FLAO|nr:hypothetical protein [Flavobacterium pectinovorum]TPG45252.1 hypothetical protein EAH81_01220 [Flavobacterium pectinovorum]